MNHRKACFHLLMDQQYSAPPGMDCRTPLSVNCFLPVLECGGSEVFSLCLYWLLAPVGLYANLHVTAQYHNIPSLTFSGCFPLPFSLHVSVSCVVGCWKAGIPRSQSALTWSARLEDLQAGGPTPCAMALTSNSFPRTGLRMCRFLWHWAASACLGKTGIEQTTKQTRRVRKRPDFSPLIE